MNKGLDISEEKLRATLNSLTEAVFVIGPPHREVVEVCNLAVKDVFGYEPEELEGGTTEKLHISHESFQKFGEISEAFLEEHDEFEIEYQMRRKDGTVIDTLNTVTVLYEEKGWQGGVVSVVRDITERKEVERTLRETQQEYATIARNLPRGAIQVFDREFNYLFSQGQELEKVGLMPSKLLGKNIADIFPEDTVKRITEQFQRVLEGETVSFEGDFTGRTFLTNAAPLYDERGKVDRVLSLSVNITERKEVEYKLQERLKEINCLYAVNRDMRRLDDKRKLYRRILDHLKGSFQYPAHTAPVLEVAGEQYTTEKYHNGLDHFLSSAVEVKGKKEGELRVYYTGGEDFLLPEEQDLLDSVTEALGLYLENRRNQEEVSRRERRFRGLIENVADVITVINREGKIKFLSPSMETVFGYKPESLIGQDIFPYLHPDDVSGTKDLIKHIAREPGAMERMEGRIKHKDGEYRYFESMGKNELHNPAVSGIVITSRDITDRVRYEEKIERQAEELEVLYQSALDISGVLNRDRMVEKIHENIQRLFIFNFFTVYEYHPRKEEVEVIYLGEEGADKPLKLGQTFPLAESGLIGWVIRNQESLNVGNLEKDSLPVLPQIVNAAPKSWMGVPLKASGELFGVISVQDPQLNKFDQDHRRLLESLASQVAIAFQNVNLFEDAERRLQILQSLRSIDVAISNTLDREISLGILMEQAMIQLDADAVDVLLWYPDIQMIQYDQGKGFHTYRIEETELRLGEGYPGRVVLSRDLVKVPDISKADPPFSRSQLMSMENFASYFAAPLVSKGEVKGVLEIFHREKHTPTREWFELLETLAGQAAIAIDNAELFESLQRANTELTLAYDETLQGWAKTLELRDVETEGHSRRVTDLVLKLANMMGVKDKKMLHIYRGALLHDIGKMGIPDRILHKPGPLNEEEWELMKKHPTMAYDLLSQIDFLEDSLDIPYCHHERWDGSGYPRGLEGEEIPLSARIFTVVDVWDALLSERPYREAWSKEKTVSYLQEQAGKEFDPQVVQAFLELI